MEFLKDIEQWLQHYPSAMNTIRYLIWVVGIVVTIGFVRRFLKKSLPNNATRYKSQKGIEIIGYILLGILSISFFTGTVKNFTIVIGLLTAGIALTLQELILSIAGSLYIFLVKVYKPGDRIEINSIKGDVIDIDSVYTTMMEIGEWVSSDNYSGRIVKLSNAFVFKGPVYNYSKDFPFIWDEFNLPIRYESDVELTKAILTKIAREVLTDYVTISKEQWKEVVSKYYIENAIVEPTIAITLTDNWIQFNVRYIVDYKRRRLVKHELQENIQKAIKETSGSITIASTTLEVVKMPDTTIHMGSQPSS